MLESNAVAPYALALRAVAVVFAEGEQLHHLSVRHAAAVVEDDEVQIFVGAKLVEAHPNFRRLSVGAIVDELGRCAERPRVGFVSQI